MIDAEEFGCITAARWQFQYKGRWCPVTRMFSGPKQTDNPMHATSAAIFTGEEDGAWLAAAVSPGDIVARTPGCAPEWLDWAVVARNQKAAQRARQARQTTS